MKKLYWKIRNWVYYNAPAGLAWAVELETPGHWQTFFAFGYENAQAKYPNDFVTQRDWMC